MKKVIYFTLALMFFVLAFSFFAQAQYTLDEYKDEVGYRGSLDPQLDPIYQIISRGIGVSAGTTFFVDNNSGSDSDNGLTWDKAFLTITYAMRVSHVDIAKSLSGADRNTIYVRGDDFDEDWTDLAQKTDIVGVGSDDGNKGPRILGNHVIDAVATGYNYMGCRFINMTFVNQTANDIFVVPTGHHGLEWINCRFESNSSILAPSALDITQCNDTRIVGCEFISSVNPMWSGGAIDFGDGLCQNTDILNNFIDAVIGITIGNSASGLSSRIEGNTIYASTLTIDDNSDVFYIVNNTLITATTIAGGTDLNVALSVGNVITGSDGTRAIPVIDKLDHLIAVADNDDPVDNSIIADLASSTSNWDTFTPADDSLEAIRDKIDTLTGIGFRGTAESHGTETEIKCGDLKGFGDDYFNVGWSVTIIDDATDTYTNQTQDIIDYVSSSGTFTLNASFGGQITTPDKIYVRRVEELNLDDPTMLGASGVIWYIDSGKSGGDGSGTTWENAFASIPAAITGAMTANNGDVAYLAAGHAETVSSALSINEAGVSYIGVREHGLQPTITFDASTDAQLDIAASNVLFENITFVAGLGDLLIGIDVATAGDGLHLKNCKFVDGTPTTFEFLVTINLQAGADDVLIEGCDFISVGGAATHGIKGTGAVDNLQIKDCWFFGNYTIAPIWSDQALTSCRVENNTVHQITGGQHAIEFADGATGDIVNNRLYSNAYATQLDAGAMMCMGNIGVDVTDEAGYPIPAIGDSTDNYIGTNSADNDAVTSAIVANVNGSLLERTEAMFDGGDIAYNSPRYLTASIDFTDSQWNTVATHEVFTVTGTVRVKVFVVCTETLIGDNHIQFGIAGASDAYIAQTTKTDIATGEIWHDASPDNGEEDFSDTIDDVIIVELDIGYEVITAVATDGTLVFYLWWVPISSDGAVVVGAGGTLGG